MIKTIINKKFVQLYCWVFGILIPVPIRAGLVVYQMDRFQYSFNKHYHVLYSKEIELSLPKFHSWKGCQCKNSFLLWVQYLRGIKILQRVIGSYFVKEAISCNFETASQCLLSSKFSSAPRGCHSAWLFSIERELFCDHLPLISLAPIFSALITIDFPNESTIN